MNRPQRIVIGLSGGVDSSVSAHLLKQQGHEVVGLFMKNWEDDDSDATAEDAGYCTSRQDWLDAASVADVLGIDIEFVNFAAEYKDRVFATFLAEYQAGRTPNPDVLCNAEIKFKAFLDHALALGAEAIATGHYARTAPQGTGTALLKGLDPLKDQSYFLHRLLPHQLARTHFPLGGIPKTEVRRIAQEIGLPNAQKKDSTGICFIGERPFREFLGRYLAHRSGPITDLDSGRVVGQHQGLSFYTLGQRQGLGIGGVKGGRQDEHGVHLPWFVARKDMARNVLEVVQGHDHPALQSHRVWVQDLSWTVAPPAPGRFAAKTRYRQADAPCDLAWEEEGRLRLDFPQAQWAVTPGQSAVIYDGDVCVGGGIIVASE
ncbi:tRNA 2-thiouridine(34) synthase MnmA [Amphibiibacter pelophylacis]|uniref:tRNA 2-thiouridine(34) synthase MnmA n=1 Tax=Amphibiibacter pelophylacis TaxID=1799477 RepID=A0ACC6P2B5_9BURK